MNILLRAVWAPTDETESRLADRLLRFIESLSSVDGRLAGWHRKTDGTEVEAAPLLGAVSQANAQDAIRNGSLGTLQIKGTDRVLGYVVSGWLGDETCGADFDLFLGVCDVGIPAPNSLSLNLVGGLMDTNLKSLLVAIVESLDADAADITTDAFLYRMLDEHEGIVSPSGGVMVYIRKGQISHPCAASAPIAEGSLLTLRGKPDPTASAWFDDAAQLHRVLAPWRTDPVNPNRAGALRGERVR